MSTLREEFEYRLNRMGYNLTNINLRIPIQALWTVLEGMEPSGDADLEEAYKQVFGDINWTSVEHELPEYNKVVLAKGITHSGIALARHIPGLCKWHVQPFKGKWYSTRSGITHWAPLGCTMVSDSDNAFLKVLEELRVTDELLEERNRVMEAIPPCPVHGCQCMPHALKWIEEQKLQQVYDIINKILKLPWNLEAEVDICPKCGRTRDAGVCWGYDCDGGIPFQGDE